MHSQTQKILETFEEIDKIPRCSKHEEKLFLWLKNWAKTHDFKVKTDSVNNILIKVPPTQGYENYPIVVIQGHMDMVCAKARDSAHDFSREPIRCRYEGDWLKGTGTSIGADNGIGLAIGLVLAKDKEVKHPQLELLFTVDEETGLTGANALEKGFFEGNILLNLDSEDEGVFTVGCAGGQNSEITLSGEYSPYEDSEYVVSRITARGMKGGHSGVEISEKRANAIVITVRSLDALRKQADKDDFMLITVEGGNAHNAIPSYSEALLAVKRSEFEKIKRITAEFEKTVKAEYAKTDPELSLKIEKIENRELSEKEFLVLEIPKNQALTEDSKNRIINLLLALPHGVFRMSAKVPGLVETSSNLATVRNEEKKLVVLLSQRSSVMSKLEELTGKIEAVAGLAGGEVRHGNGYPAWQPDFESKLLAKCREIYLQTFGNEAKIEVVHAGLECAVIGAKYPAMEMISLGPTIKNTHSPEEKVYIPSIERVWEFLVALLENIK